MIDEHGVRIKCEGNGEEHETEGARSESVNWSNGLRFFKGSYQYP